MDYAIIQTNKGVMLAELETERAPKTAANFRDLARGTKPFTDPRTRQEVKRPYYDGITFHRVAKDFVVQAGCPLGTGTGGPGFRIDLEIHKALRHDGPGVLSMARTNDPNSAGSQFFITLAATPFLDDKYAVFGRVIAGLDVVKKLGNTPIKDGLRDGPPAEQLKIETVTIVESDLSAAKAKYASLGGL